jgi:hypothetical protein
MEQTSISSGISKFARGLGADEHGLNAEISPENDGRCHRKIPDNR